MLKEYWDSCLWLAYLQNKPEEQGLVDILAARLRLAESAAILIVVSTLVLAEIRPVRNYDAEHADIIWDLFHTNRPFIKMVSVNPRLGELAGTIGSEHDITSPDAVHVATAWSDRVDFMLTIDGDSPKESRRSGKLLTFDGKIGKPPLAIKVPTMPDGGQFTLPESPKV